METFLKAHERNRKNKIIEAGLDANQTESEPFYPSLPFPLSTT